MYQSTFEIFLFWLMMIAGTGLWALALTTAPTVLLILLLVFLIGSFLIKKILMVYIAGNAVIVSDHQLPQIFRIYKELAGAMQLAKPPILIVSKNTLFNKVILFLTRKKYICIDSEFVNFFANSSTYDTLRFYLAFFLLKNVRYQHFWQQLIMLPAFLIPVINFAYLRARVYTLDINAMCLCGNPEQAAKTLVRLSTKLFANVIDVNFLELAAHEQRFNFVLALLESMFSPIPRLSKRLLNLITVYPKVHSLVLQGTVKLKKPPAAA